MKHEELLKLSRDIYLEALLIYQPKAVIMMFSGGGDSLTCYHVARQLGIKFDYVMHGNTRTGIPETTKFCINEAERLGDKMLIADAGDAYINYVMRKGFFGKGLRAHSYSYHILKWTHFRREVSQQIRHRRRNYPILFINGARRSESARREVTMKNPYRVIGNSNIWVNLINDWSKEDCDNYLEGNAIKRNPVSINLCRSGECMCGTLQSEGDRTEAAVFYPAWGKNLDALEKAVIAKHGWGWNDNKPKPLVPKSQIELFQPMCVGCKGAFQENLELTRDEKIADHLMNNSL